MRRLSSRSLVIAWLVFSATRSEAGQLLVVDATHPAGTFADIQSAVDAAVDDDALLVKSGTYARFEIVDKALSVVAEVGADVIVIDGARVSSTSATRTVVLAGLKISGAFLPVNAPEALVLQNDSGAVRIEDCQLFAAPGTQQFSTPHAGVVITFCTDVAFTRCTVRGEGPGSGSFDYARGGPGLLATGSKLTAHDSTFQGGQGGWCDFCTSAGSTNDLNCNYGYSLPGDGADGGPGCKLIASDLLASNCVVRGGNGGDAHAGIPSFPFFGACGGHGVVWQPAVNVWTLVTSPQGGAGGIGIGSTTITPGVACSPNTSVLHPLSGAARSLDADRTVREGAPLALQATGVAGDRIAMFVSFATEYQLAAPFRGAYLVQRPPGGRFLRLGTADANGLMTTIIPAPELGSGIEARTLYLQSIHVGVQGAPAGTTLGPVREVLIVDRSL